MGQQNIRSSLSKRVSNTVGEEKWDALLPSEKQSVISSILSDLSTRQFCEAMYCTDDVETLSQTIIYQIGGQEIVKEYVLNSGELAEETQSYPVFSFTKKNRTVSREECEEIQSRHRQQRHEIISKRLVERLPSSVVNELSNDDVFSLAGEIEAYIDVWRWEELQNQFRDEVGAILLKQQYKKGKTEYVNDKTVDVFIDEVGPYRIASWVESINKTIERKTITRGDWVSKSIESVVTDERREAALFREQCYSGDEITNDMLQSALRSLENDDYITADTYADGISWLLIERTDDIEEFTSMFVSWIQSVDSEIVLEQPPYRIFRKLSSFVGNDTEKAVEFAPFIGDYISTISDSESVCSLLEILYIAAKYDVGIVWPYMDDVTALSQTSENRDVRVMCECVIDETTD